MTKEQAALNAITDLNKYFNSADYTWEDAVFYCKSVVRDAANGHYELEGIDE